MSIQGLHHITIGCNDAQRTIDFYAGVLGLRFVKQTVNFDDPGSYHLYFGDERGTPGSAVTFFEWPGVPKGRPGHRRDAPRRVPGGHAGRAAEVEAAPRRSRPARHRSARPAVLHVDLLQRSRRDDPRNCDDRSRVDR